MFIFGIFRRSWAAMPPVKYEWDWYNLKSNFARPKKFAYGEIYKESFSNYQPGTYDINRCNRRRVANVSHGIYVTR